VNYVTSNLENFCSTGTPFTDASPWKFRGPFSARPRPRTRYGT